MKFLDMCKAVALTALLSLSAAPALAQSGSLTTTYDVFNSRAGVTLDVTPSSNMTIDSFDMNIGDRSSTVGSGAGLPANVAVYWRAGTAAGFSNSSTGWTLLGKATVVSQCRNLATHLTIGGLALVGGQTYGLYIDVENFSEDVRARVFASPTPVSNADITISPGENKGSPAFSSETFAPSLFSGAVYYTKVPANTCASEGYTGTKLTWCKNICENGLTGATLDIWIHRWINRYRDLPYCAREKEEGPPQEQPPA